MSLSFQSAPLPRRSAFAALVGSTLASLAAAQSPQWIAAEQAKLLPASGAGGSEQFGREVSISGDVAAVGAWLGDQAGGNSGEVYVFRRAGTAWAEEAVLVPNAPGGGDVFGYAVEIEGDTLVIGAYGDDITGADSGSVYVYVRNGASWVQQAVLTGSAGTVGDNFGYEVALHGDLIVVGAPLDDPGSKTDAGSAYVFARQENGTPGDLTDDTWCQHGNLAPAALLAGDQFGYSVAVSPSNDTIAISSPRDDELSASDTGSVYMFGRNDNGTPANPCDDTWVQEGAKVFNLSNASGDHFGEALALEDDTLLVGSPLDDHDSIASGDCGSFVLVERLPGPVWVPVSKHYASDFAAGDQFAYELALQGSSLAVSGVGDNGVLANNDEGSTYFFRRNMSGVWQQQLKLTAGDGSTDDYFGHSVDLDGDTVISGAPLDDPIFGDSGSAYVHVIERDRFATYCHGDGTGVACPCTNNSIAGATQGCKNTRGLGAMLRPSGSTDLGADDFELYATNVPTGNACVLFGGMSSNAGVPFFAGLKCVPPPTVRMGIKVASSTGHVAYGPGLNNGLWSAGQTWYFQLWYRDPTFTGCAPAKTTNLSSGVQVTF